MKREVTYKIINTAGNDPYITIGSANTTSNDYWRFGRDNLFPQAIAILNRRSPVHRGIIQSKARYISGKGITCDENIPGLVDWIKSCNAFNENLREPIRRLIFDKKAFGNAYIELVTNNRRSFLNFYHHDATKCRVSKDKKYIFLHHDWTFAGGNKADRKDIPLYPVFEDTEKDGLLRSMIHIKEYEPQFQNYGIMEWVAGLDVSAIAYKTDKWNISRLDNSFNSSGVMVVSGEFKDDQEFDDFNEAFQDEFIGEGKQGKILLLQQQPGVLPDAGTRFVPIDQKTEGDWQQLHTQSTDDLIIAHGWFRSLSGIADNTGFDTNRILNEYEVALNTIILDEQDHILNLLRKILREILRIDGSSLAFINKPPATAKPMYMKIWEARKADGLPYDENNPAEQLYLASLTAKQVTPTTPAQ